MPNNHVITKEIGNLRGFSTDSFYLRPPNVADRAINIQRGPDGTLQLRRGYQCQIAKIGGMGIGTFDDPESEEVKTVCVGMDGFVYNKLTKQIYLYYDGTVTGEITGVTNASPAIVEDVSHGLITGAIVTIHDVGGLTAINNLTYTITVIDADHYSLDGSDTTLDPVYTSGGYWSIAFADNRYIKFSIFTDARYIYSPAGQSITCNITVNRAAQVDGNFTNVNTFNVLFGHELAATDFIKVRTTLGLTVQRNVVSVTSTSITIDGTPISVSTGTSVNQFFDILFGRGFDFVIAPFTIAQFIAQITDPTTGVYGLKVAVNGDTNLQAAFLQIVEPQIITSNLEFTMDYWYWDKINFTVNPPMPGSASIKFQNSIDFEIASMTAYDDVIYIANGLDYPQKYDGQTVYRTGMPFGVRPVTSDNTVITSTFIQNDVYQYITTYEQIDNKGHIVEGERSEIQDFTVVTTNDATNVTLTNLIAKPQNNWNTNTALAVGGASTSYGPDIDGFYYDLTAVNPGYTLKIGDSAYYGDLTSAVLSADPSPNPNFVLPVLVGHGVIEGDIVYFYDNTGAEIQRQIVSVTDTSIQIQGSPVTTDFVTYPNILVFKVSKVLGNVSIVDGNQSNVNTINVKENYPTASGDPTIQVGDVVEFIDSSNNLQRRNVTSVTPSNTVTIDGIPISINGLTLISSTNQRADAITLQRFNANAATLSDGTTNQITNAISNNLRITIYRTRKNETFNVNGKMYFVVSLPNNGLGAGTQTYVDQLDDLELGREFDNPDRLPNPPPISKYVKSFGNQLFYAGGERGQSENSDRVFFSDGNQPESVPLAENSFNVPNLDDDITGIGVSGTTLVTTKNNSLWGATGNFLTGDIEVVQIAPGTNIGCSAHATIQAVGTLMYFVYTNGVYAITENQLFPTDSFGNPIALSLPIDIVFRQKNFLKQNQYVLKRAVAVNYTKDNQYLLFLPCEDIQSNIRTSNANSIILAYDYEEKNWFQWENMNAAGGMVVVDDNLYFQERRFSAVNGNTANLYKQHRFYRLIDHADHAGPQKCEWLSSWEDLGQPEVRKKFCRCVLLLDRLSQLQQDNNPTFEFASYLNRLPNLKNTIVNITQVDNIRNSPWSFSGWGWNLWAGYKDSFITVNLKRGTVAKSIQVGFKIQGIDMDMRFAGFQLEAIPENRKSVLR